MKHPFNSPSPMLKAQPAPSGSHGALGLSKEQPMNQQEIKAIEAHWKRRGAILQAEAKKGVKLITQEQWEAMKALAKEYRFKGMHGEEYRVLHRNGYSKARKEEEKREGKYREVWERIESIVKEEK